MAALSHTVRSVRAAMRKGTVYWIHRWVRRTQWNSRRYIVSDVRFRHTKLGQGAGWLEVRVGHKRPRWGMVLVDSDLEFK